jgi:hypothetical protein
VGQRRTKPSPLIISQSSGGNAVHPFSSHEALAISYPSPLVSRQSVVCGLQTASVDQLNLNVSGQHVTDFETDSEIMSAPLQTPVR